VNTKTENLSTVILAAGMSTRMGISKPLLFCDSRNTFIEKIVDTYLKLGVSKIVIVANAQNEVLIRKLVLPEVSGVLIVINDKPEAERFYSLKLGAAAVGVSNCFLHNADNPFVTVETLKLLLEKVEPNNYVVPSYSCKKGHPVLLGSGIIEKIIAEESTDHKINEFLKQFEYTEIPVSDGGVDANVDTRKDYLFYFSQDMWDKSFDFYNKLRS
jgi:CTP:molybdopterin cytidylyltransferase MocA